MEQSDFTSKKKRANGSLFFWYPLYAIILFLFALLTVFLCDNSLQLGLMSLYCFALLMFSSVIPPRILLRKFLKLHLFFLPVCILVLLSEVEGKMYNLSFFTITDRGIFAAVQLYLRLAALFWLTKVCTTLIRPDTMQKGATYLFWPLRFTGLKADEAAHIMYTALFMLPELLSSLPVFLKRGHKGLADFFAAVEKHDTEAVYAPGRLTRYYEILLVLSLPFMVGAILLGRL